MSLDSELLKELGRLINRASVIAEAPAGNMSAIGRQHPDSRRPPARERSTLDELARRFRRVRDDEDLRALIAWAEREIRAITHAPDREPETREQFRYRICAEYEGRPARMVADRERISIALVRQIRLDDGRDARRGHKLPEDDANGA